MTLSEKLEEMKNLIEKKTSLRSDDFGHNCHDLLVAESLALTEIGLLSEALIQALEKAIEQRDFYASELDTYMDKSDHTEDNQELLQILEDK